MTEAQRNTLIACVGWASPFEICHRRLKAEGEIIDPAGQRQVLGRLRNLGFVEYDMVNDTWRITPAGRAALAEKGGG